MANGTSVSFTALPKVYISSISWVHLPLTARESHREEKDHGGSRLRHLTYNLSGDLRDTLDIFPGPLMTRSRRSRLWGLFQTSSLGVAGFIALRTLHGILILGEIF